MHDRKCSLSTSMPIFSIPSFILSTWTQEQDFYRITAQNIRIYFIVKAVMGGYCKTFIDFVKGEN